MINVIHTYTKTGLRQQSLNSALNILCLDFQQCETGSQSRCADEALAQTHLLGPNVSRYRILRPLAARAPVTNIKHTSGVSSRDRDAD